MSERKCIACLIQDAEPKSTCCGGCWSDWARTASFTSFASWLILRRETVLKPAETKP